MADWDPRRLAGILYSGAIVVVAAFAAWPIYRTPWFVLLVGVSAVVALAIALVAARRRWSGWVVALALAAVTAVLGVPLAVPSRLGPITEILTGFGELGGALVLGWKDLLTVDLPVGTYRNLLVPALVVFLVGTCALLLLSWRADRAFLGASVVAVAMCAFGIVFGSSQTSSVLELGPISLAAPRETALGAALVICSVGWLSWRGRDARARALRRVSSGGRLRSTRRVAQSDRRRVALGAAIIAGSVALPMIVVPALAAPLERTVLRDSVGPEIDLSAEISPLTLYRALFDDQRADEVLFTVEAEYGTADRVRLATLTDYDGEVLRPGDDLHFVRMPSARAIGDENRVAAQVTIEGQRGIWLPTIGEVSEVVFDGDRAADLGDGFYYSAQAGAGVELAEGGLRTGESYRVNATLTDAEALESIASPGHVFAEAPTQLSEWMQRHASGEGGAALAGLVDLLRSRGYLSHGLTLTDPAPVWVDALDDYRFEPSRSGHSSDRIDAMFAALLEREDDPRAAEVGNYVAAVGDDEQFSVAVALMARELGFPSRVVVGARLQSDDPVLPVCTDGACRSRDLAAWVEVQGADGQWVSIDVTPQYSQTPTLETTEQRDPENVTEVQPDSAREVSPPDPVQDEAGATDDAAPIQSEEPSWFWPVLRVAAISLLAITLLFGPMVVIILAKAIRRRARRRRPAPAARIQAGWDELLDSAADVGRATAKTATRTEAAGALGTTHAVTLAAGADRAVFAVDASSMDEADSFWSLVDADRRELARSRRWPRRVASAVSLRSFRRGLGGGDGRSR